MTDTTANRKNIVERDMDSSAQRDEKQEQSQNDAGEGNIEHVTEKGLPPGIEANDLFNPNGNRPRDLPNGDNS